MNLETGAFNTIKTKFLQYVLKNIEYIQRKIISGNNLPASIKEQTNTSHSLENNETNFQDLNKIINEFELSKIIKDSNKILSLFKG